MTTPCIASLFRLIRVPALTRLMLVSTTVGAASAVKENERYAHARATLKEAASLAETSPAAAAERYLQPRREIVEAWSVRRVALGKPGRGPAGYCALAIRTWRRADF